MRELVDPAQLVSLIRIIAHTEDRILVLVAWRLVRAPALGLNEDEVLAGLEQVEYFSVGERNEENSNVLNPTVVVGDAGQVLGNNEVAYLDAVHYECA